MAGSTKYVLGIDLGTTSVKVALIDAASRDIVSTKCRETNASIYSDDPQGNEQTADKILTALQMCVSGLSKENLSKVSQIGISGQMHGVILWKKNQAWTRNSFGRFEVDTVSSLYTWQDGRCSPEFLDELPQPHSHLKVASGHGCATLFWLQRNKPELLEKYDCAGTIQDLVVCMLCDCQEPTMSVQNAASWGYFDCTSNTWNTDILSAAGFPVHLLPRVSCGKGPEACNGGIAASAGGDLSGTTDLSVQQVWYNIAVGTPVAIALGDLQCSFLARLPAADDAVLNMSTSAQLAFQMHEEFHPRDSCVGDSCSIEYFPYFHSRYLAVAASLTGGNVMAAFVKMLQQWTHELGLGVPEAKIWEKLAILGQENNTANNNSSNELTLEIRPTIFGERHAPEQRASVHNITPQNLLLGPVYRSLCSGVIANLHSMMPRDFLIQASISRLICSGTALSKNSILQAELKRQYDLPLHLSQVCEADAAVGAALALLMK